MSERVAQDGTLVGEQWKSDSPIFQAEDEYEQLNYTKIKALEDRVEQLEQVAVNQHRIINNLITLVQSLVEPTTPPSLIEMPKLVGIERPN